MARRILSRPFWHRKQPTSFTLIELLTVMAVIGILAALTLSAAMGLMAKAARSRAQAEIRAMSGGLESYKIDNGIYPPAAYLLGSNTAAYPVNPSGNTAYIQSSQVLYEALVGKVNFLDTTLIGRNYMNFTMAQMGNGTTAAGTAYAATKSTYVKDPWSYPYGYSTGDGTANNVPTTGTNFFDLWTTGGTTTAVTHGIQSTNTWISNWSVQ